MDQSRASWNQIAAWLSRVEALARFASPSLKVKMRDDERVGGVDMALEGGFQVVELARGDELLCQEPFREILDEIEQRSRI